MPLRALKEDDVDAALTVETPAPVLAVLAVGGAVEDGAPRTAA